LGTLPTAPCVSANRAKYPPKVAAIMTSASTAITVRMYVFSRMRDCDNTLRDVWIVPTAVVTGSSWGLNVNVRIV
jgi:hypothetical protein